MSIFSIYGKVSLTGGTDDDLDGIEAASINNGDKAMVFTNEFVSGLQSTDDSVVYVYIADSSSGLDEDLPWVVKPDDETGDMRWILVSTSNPNIWFMTAYEDIEQGKAVRVYLDIATPKAANAATLTELAINSFSDLMSNSVSTFPPYLTVSSGGTLLCMYYDNDATDLVIVAGTVSGATG